MDSAIPPGLPRSPTGITSTQGTQNELVEVVKPSEKPGNMKIQNEISGDDKVVSRQEEQRETGRSNNEKASWVEVAQDKKSLKKYDLTFINTEGEKMVEIPDEIIEKADLLWDDYLIGKFLDSAPHVARVYTIVNRIWNQGDHKQQIDVHVVDDTTMKFKVTDPGMRARIVKRGMWNIGNVPLVVTKWSRMN